MDINNDPDKAVDIPASLAIPAIEGQIAGSLSGEYSIFGGIWSQHWAQHNNSSQYKSEDSYNITSADYNNEWDLLYSDALVDAKIAADKAKIEGNWNVNLQAVALQSFTFQVLADLYDMVPFSQSLSPDDFSQPTFDSGEAVYAGLIARLDEALAQDFDAVTNTLNPNDFLFGDGSLANQIGHWIAFANTLKLKLYLRQMEVNPSLAMTGISAMINANVPFLTTADAAISDFEDADSKSFPLYESDRRQLNTGNNLRASYTLVRFLEENGDVRASHFFNPASGGSIVGVLNGSFDVPSADLDPLSHSQVKLSPTQNFYFFSVEEVHFMLAEAYLRVMNNAAEAKKYYDAGVIAAFDRYSEDGSALVASGGAYEFPEGGTFDEQFKAIMMQKWVAYVYRGYESFFEQNRTGYPEVSTITSYPCDITYGEAISGTTSCDTNYKIGDYIISYETVLNPGQLPRRLVFPDSELNVNPNSPAKVAVDVPVWWDVN
ncbi:SusD/RagB family nutrient-binding outer membrane lipoprotein [Membranihabitans marinus]